MSLGTELAKIFDNLPPGKVLVEAQAKLNETVMYVNGTKPTNRFYIKQIGTEGTLVFDPRFVIKGNFLIPARDVTLFKPFLPESGTYLTTQNTYVVLERKPIRQWHKSWKDNLYTISAINGNAHYKDIIEESRQEIICDNTGFVYYLGKRIGHFHKSKLFCTNPLFKQEMIDWVKHEKIL
jgi:hypothetical protein